MITNIQLLFFISSFTALILKKCINHRSWPQGILDYLYFLLEGGTDKFRYNEILQEVVKKDKYEYNNEYSREI